MASHGVPRVAHHQEQSPEARQKERKDIEEYRSLVEYVREKVEEEDFSPELLEKTGTLLQRNPEYYTIWNVRRRIFAKEFESILALEQSGELVTEARTSQILDILMLDLQFLFPLLLKFPKCYWIWNHRIWLLQQSSILLPAARARKIWQEELDLVKKMLSRDNRNFHGWGYRRFVVQNLESETLNGQSMARDEYGYTTKMIQNNLSNFSAWHSRTKTILRLLAEEHASPDERRKMFDEELALIHKALFDPYDQSLWFYHQTLLSALDPDRCQDSMIPELDLAQKVSYLTTEMEFISEILEDADDCKWAYQALVECKMIETKLKDGLSEADKDDVSGWLTKLKGLDPLRHGRWVDMEAKIASS